MPSKDEMARIAAAANQLRPEWPTRSVLTYLERDHASRAYRDLAVAMAHVACDPQTQTPRRLSEAGPWWKATGDVGGTQVLGPRTPRCTVEGHEFELASNCPRCKWDAAVEADLAARAAGLIPDASLSAAQLERNAQGARAVLDAAPAMDVRRMAAGEKDED